VEYDRFTVIITELPTHMQASSIKKRGRERADDTHTHAIKYLQSSESCCLDWGFTYPKTFVSKLSGE